ncbi:MAG: DUF1211 domain-containing protein [Saprospiraceae bacterium]|nr:DUF1211 domain-containing protein [Saprospiraceae bacterium]
MKSNRMEAFSDGVIAIIITIMVLEMKVPHGTDLQSLSEVWPVFVSYVLSFLYLAIYWNNHHHLMHTVEFVRGPILWANLHLLFWLSLVPFVTGWMGENDFAMVPVALYGLNLLMAAIAYYILQLQILRTHGKDSPLAQALGSDLKGKISPFLYIVGIAIAFYWPLIAGLLYLLVAIIWIMPDRRIERLYDPKS